MIIVIGGVTVRPETLDEALALSKQHVKRSRQEAGCVSHQVTLDAEEPNRLVFVERWQDMDALQQHFQVPASSDFVTAIADMATSGPEMHLYESSEIPRH